MPFTQIDDVPLQAENLSKTGAVFYLRWTDAKDELYVQIVRICSSRGVGDGTFSKRLFYVGDIAMGIPHIGHNPIDRSTEEISDKNMSGFLRAAKNDIMRRADERAKIKIS